jgi:hypothetical protein
MKMALQPGGTPVHHCGALATLSTVTRDGTTQRVIHRWPDKFGELMNQNPIQDWAAWRAALVADRVAAAAPDGLDGLSPLKRKMLEKKLRKGTLRAAA